MDAQLKIFLQLGQSAQHQHQTNYSPAIVVGEHLVHFYNKCITSDIIDLL